MVGGRPQEKVQALEAQVQELQARLAALNVEREQHKQQLAALSQRVTTVAPEPPPPLPEEKPGEVRCGAVLEVLSVPPWSAELAPPQSPSDCHCQKQSMIELGLDSRSGCLGQQQVSQATSVRANGA